MELREIYKEDNIMVSNASWAHELHLNSNYNSNAWTSSGKTPLFTETVDYELLVVDPRRNGFFYSGTPIAAGVGVAASNNTAMFGFNIGSSNDFGYQFQADKRARDVLAFGGNVSAKYSAGVDNNSVSVYSATGSLVAFGSYSHACKHGIFYTNAGLGVAADIGAAAHGVKNPFMGQFSAGIEYETLDTHHSAPCGVILGGGVDVLFDGKTPVDVSANVSVGIEFANYLIPTALPQKAMWLKSDKKKKASEKEETRTQELRYPTTDEESGTTTWTTLTRNRIGDSVVIGGITYPKNLIKKQEEKDGMYTVVLKDGTQLVYEKQNDNQMAQVSLNDKGVTEFEGISGAAITDNKDKQDKYIFWDCENMNIDVSDKTNKSDCDRVAIYSRTGKKAQDMNNTITKSEQDSIFGA